MDRRLKYKQKMISQGKCPTCGRHKSEESTRCELCLEKDMIRKQYERHPND